jgi:hypothetical protein
MKTDGILFAQTILTGALKMRHETWQRRGAGENIIYGRFMVSRPRFRKNGAVLATYDLCLDCQKPCKCKGPPWRRLECPSFSSQELRFKFHRIVDMTENELLKRIAYA